MKELWYVKFCQKVRQVICKMSGHTYGCCDNMFFNCKRCRKDWEKALEEYCSSDAQMGL